MYVCMYVYSLPSTDLGFSSLTRTLTLKASKGGVKKGDEVFITYGLGFRV
jgi:hypothetical protein